MRLLVDRRRTFRIVLVLLTFLAVFVALDWWTYNFQILPGVVTWYPPDGLAFALLLALGPEFAPILIVASLISSFYIYQFNTPPLYLLGWAILLALLYGVATWSLRRIRFDARLQSTGDMIWLITVTSGVSMILALVSISSSVANGLIPESERFSALARWWLGEMTGVLAITPALLIHVMPGMRRWIDQGSRFDRQSIVIPSREVIGQALALLATLFVILNVKWPGDLEPIFLVALPLIWVALQFGLSGISLAIGAVNFGIMMTPWILQISPAHLVSLQVQLLIVSVASLVNGSIISENRQAKSTSHYRTTSEILRRQQQVAREVSIILVSAVAIWIVEYNFNLYGSLREWERRMGLRWLDETLVMSTFLGLAFAFFSYRRWKDVQAEIQERQKAEAALHQLNLELEHANRTKDEFLANMSHELRTPLNSILGMSEILLEQKRDPLSDYQNRSIQLIESSGQHLLALINDVLDLSKIEAGKLDFYPEIVDLPELIRISLAFAKGPASKKSIRLTHKELQPITKIFADPRRLKQILINLLINAVKFTPEGGAGYTTSARQGRRESYPVLCYR